MGKKDRDFWQSAGRNNASFMQYYNRLVELAVSMFDWQNLPDTIDPRFLELCLFTDGKALFFKDEVLGYLTLQVAIAGQMNVYRIPTGRRAYAVNGYNKQLTEKDSVIIWNNMLHINSMLDAQQYATRLSNIDRAIDVNINAQKTPILIKCDESQRLTMQNVYKQYDGNMPVIFADKNLNDKGFQVLATEAPFVAPKLYELKTELWNEALTFLGISNINVVKKERMITDEVQRNQGGIVASRYSRLESRREACRQINEMFGLDIWCDYREDYRPLDELIGEDATRTGGEEDE